MVFPGTLARGEVDHLTIVGVPVEVIIGVILRKIIHVLQADLVRLFQRDAHVFGEYRVHLAGGDDVAGGFGIEGPGVDDGIQYGLVFFDGAGPLSGTAVEQLKQINVPGIIIEGREELIADVHSAFAIGAVAVVKEISGVEEVQFLLGQGDRLKRSGQITQFLDSAGREDGETLGGRK